MSREVESGQARVGNQLLGLAFGFLMGLAFVAGAWGIDAFGLWRASAYLPWLRCGLGAVLILPLAVLTGWLVARSDSALVGFVSWVLVAFLFSYWSGHVPYELTSWAVGKLLPVFEGLQVYPFNPSALTRLWIVAAISGVLFAIGGALQTVVMDSARATTMVARKIFLLSVCLPFFLGAGIFSDLIIQRPLRQPLLVINDLLQFALNTEGQQVDKLLARSMHLGAIDGIRRLLHQPRRLIMGDYDQDTLESGRVLVDFNGNWVRCWVITGQPSYCQLSNEHYGQGFSCLWRTQGKGDETCRVRLADDAQVWFEEWRKQGGNPWIWQPEIQVRAQYGTVALLDVTLGQVTYDCRFRDVPTMTLEACTPFPGE